MVKLYWSFLTPMSMKNKHYDKIYVYLNGYWYEVVLRFSLPKRKVKVIVVRSTKLEKVQI